ncbi:glycosyltransferase family 2 protein [Patescibacteria group bacterium]|nr:glycosyltransferase family 2 protein [Patescibacteria group bacterium]
MKLSIVVPCYNEGENVNKVLAAYDHVITRDDIEVLLVNNGSTDETAHVLERLLPQYSRFLKIVTVPVNQGYGYGILSGLRAACGEFVGWTHGDLQTPPGDVVRALEIIEKNGRASNLYVKGKRIGRPLFDQFFTFGMSIFESAYLGSRFYDINAQPNIFHKDFFATWENPPHDFALDLYVYYQARKQRLNLLRFTVPFLKRQHGTSSWNTGLKSKWKFIKRTLQFSVELKRRLNHTNVPRP